mgnify:CR=1 FL=1
MNKQELITEILNRTGLIKKDAEDAVIAFMDVVKDSLIKGEKVSLSGFGTFEVVERAARTARNPKTGESIEVGASKSPKFKPSKSLKEAVNV